MTTEEQARELLAAEFDDIGDGRTAARIRTKNHVCEEVDVALRAIEKALSITPQQTTLAGDVEQRVATLFDAIKHGDQEHMDWLRKAIDAHFAGQPVPPSRGKGAALSTPTEREQIVAYLRAESAVLTMDADNQRTRGSCDYGAALYSKASLLSKEADAIECGEHLSPTSMEEPQ